LASTIHHEKQVHEELKQFVITGGKYYTMNRTGIHKNPVSSITIQSQKTLLVTRLRRGIFFPTQTRHMRRFPRDVARRFIDLRLDGGRCKFEFQTKVRHRAPTVPESNIAESIVENAALRSLVVNATPEASSYSTLCGTDTTGEKVPLAVLKIVHRVEWMNACT